MIIAIIIGTVAYLVLLNFIVGLSNIDLGMEKGESLRFFEFFIVVFV